MQIIKISNLDLGIEFGMDEYIYADTDQREKINNGMNRTMESGKNQNAQNKGKIHVLKNIGSGHH